MSEAETIITVISALKRTEELDIDFLLTGLKQSANNDFRRNLVRSFRNQIIQAAVDAAVRHRQLQQWVRADLYEDFEL